MRGGDTRYCRAARNKGYQIEIKLWEKLKEKHREACNVGRNRKKVVVTVNAFIVCHIPRA